jgi:hypothetical protein
MLVFSFSVGFGLAFTIHSLGRILYYGESCRFVINNSQKLPELWQISKAVRRHIKEKRPIFLDLLFCGGLGQLLLFILLGAAFSFIATLTALDNFN